MLTLKLENYKRVKNVEVKKGEEFVKRKCWDVDEERVKVSYEIRNFQNHSNNAIL